MKLNCKALLTLLAGSAGAGRQAIRTEAGLDYSTTNPGRSTQDLRPDYQLLDSSSAPVNILSGDGHAGTTSSVYQTATLDPNVFGHYEMTCTNGALVQPLAPLDPHQTYQVPFKLCSSQRDASNYLETGISSFNR